LSLCTIDLAINSLIPPFLQKNLQKHISNQACKNTNLQVFKLLQKELLQETNKQTNKQTGLSSLSKKSELCEPQSLKAEAVLQTLGICMTQHFKSGLNSEPVFQNFGEMHDPTL
jgi:hypothetical protein